MSTRLPVAIAVQRLGGTARWGELQRHVSRRDLRRAVDAGEAQRLARGRYGLPEGPSAAQVAAQVCGTVSHLSAAEHHRLPLLLPPALAHVTVRDNAQPSVPGAVRLHWSTLTAGDVQQGVTTVLRTVPDCSATLPLVESLAVADSALRLGLVATEQLEAASGAWRGKGAAAVRRVAREADARAANPFESALRALALDAGTRSFVPQVPVRATGVSRVDLADVRRRIVLEADSFEWHGNRTALLRDCRRYDELVRSGWRVLRFAWEDVMLEHAWVTEVIWDVVQPPVPTARR